MKITSTSPVQATQGLSQTARESTAAQTDPGDRVSLSSDASFVNRLREDAQEPSVRKDVVAEMQAAIRSGNFDQMVDIEKAMDSMIADF